MEKQRYFFSHDYSARNDRKCAALLKDHKAEGYGIFWAAVEMIHEEQGALLFDEITIDAIAKDMCAESALVRLVIERCINKYGLFSLEDGKLYSGRASRNLGYRAKVKNQTSEAGKASAESRKRSKEMLAKIENSISTTVDESLNGNATTVQQNSTNKIKGNKIKGNKIKINTASKKIEKPEERPLPSSEQPPKDQFSQFAIYNVEALFKENVAIFEATCMNLNLSSQKDQEFAWESLHLYHLSLVEKNSYPMGRSALIGGAEKWLIRGIGFRKQNQTNGKQVTNSNATTSSLGKSSGGFGILAEALNQIKPE